MYKVIDGRDCWTNANESEYACPNTTTDPNIIRTHYMHQSIDYSPCPYCGLETVDVYEDDNGVLHIKPRKLRPKWGLFS